MSVCGSSANAPTARDNTEFPEWNNSAQDAWEKCKQNLRTQIPPAFYDACIAPLQLIAGSNQQSVLNAPDERTLNMVRDRYWSLIQESFQSIPMAGQVSLRSHNAFQQNKKQTIAVALSTGANAGLPESIRPAGESEIRLSNHASNDQFEIICTSTGFQPAPDNISLLRRVFKTGSASLFTGAEGSGKTMLGRAIVDVSKAEGTAARYLTLEDFLTEFSLACRDRATIDWRNTLRAHRVLVIDDIQYLKSQGQKSQEELRNLIDACLDRNHVLILISARPVTDLNLNADLISRLHALIHVPLEYPDQSGREQILRAEMAMADLTLNPEAITHLAKRISRDVRRLKTAARRLITHTALQTTSFANDTKQIDALCGDLYVRPSCVPSGEIVSMVARFTNLTPEAICSSAREKRFAMARHLVAYICTEYFNYNTLETAAIIGRKDHGSVLHARRKIQNLLERDLFLRRQLEQILDALHEREPDQAPVS